MSEHTFSAYANDLNEFRQYLSDTYPLLEQVTEIELFHIRSWIAYMAEKKAGARTLQRKSSALKSFFHYLLKNSIIKRNPAKMVRTPKPPKRLPVFLEEKETQVILAAPAPGETEMETATGKLIIELLYQTGIRRAELCNLKETDIEISLKQIRVLGKRNKERLIPVNNFLLADIKEYTDLKRKTFNQPTPFLLCLKSGKPVYPNYVYRVVKTYLQQTNLSKKSPHILRHTFATQLSNNGADLSAIKDLLGHSSLAATQIYTHNNIEKLKEQYRKAHPKS